MNNRDTIKDCINSVLDQTYTDIEYIIIDGASTDGTVEIIKSYGDMISLFISEPDGGIYSAMNKGLLSATGDIIGIINSDDLYVNEFVIARVFKEFEDKCVDSVYADLVYVSHADVGKKVRHYDSGQFSPDKFVYGLMPAHPTFFVKRQIYEKYGVFRTDLKIAADFDLLIRFIFTHKISFSYIPEVLVKMRMGGVSTSVSSIWINSLEQIKVCHDNNLDSSFFKIILKYPIKLFAFFK